MENYKNDWLVLSNVSLLISLFNTHCQCSQIRFSRGSSHTDRYCPELGPQAEELPRDTHGGDTHQVDAPPGQGQWQAGVVPGAAHQVQEVNCARKVQTQLCPLHYVPQTK